MAVGNERRILRVYSPQAVYEDCRASQTVDIGVGYTDVDQRIAVGADGVGPKIALGGFQAVFHYLASAVGSGNHVGKHVFGLSLEIMVLRVTGKFQGFHRRPDSGGIFTLHVERIRRSQKPAPLLPFPAGSAADEGEENGKD